MPRTSIESALEGAILNLDLCVLAYQLHAQTIIWPLDPFAEQMKVKQPGRWFSSSRDVFLEESNTYFSHLKSSPSVVLGGPPLAFQGHKAKGWLPNVKLDPLPYDYGRVDPHRSSYARQNRRREGLVVYRAPTEITDRITEVHVVHYDRNNGPNQPDGALPMQITDFKLTGFSPRPRATDLLYCFEGATGVNKDGAGAWSLMGFVLARATASGYDVHVLFRGSRSGESRLRGYLDAKGNPDWVTDAGYGREGVWMSQKKTLTDISPARMHKGFARSARSMLPTVLRCVKEIHGAKNAAPDNIFVAGHSLGGALASCFGSAVALGTTYYDTGHTYRAALDAVAPGWPWDSMLVATFGAPPLGSKHFALLHGIAGPRTLILGLEGDPVMELLEKVGFVHHGMPVKLDGRVTGENAHQPYEIRHTFHEFWKRRQQDQGPQSWTVYDEHDAMTSLGVLSWDHATIDLFHYLNVIKKCLDHDRFPKALDRRTEVGVIDLVMRNLDPVTRVQEILSTVADARRLWESLEHVAVLTASDSAKHMTRAWLMLIVRENTKGELKIVPSTMTWVRTGK